jgi:hypothetical protein
MNTPYKEVGIPSTPAALIMPMAVNHRISFVPPRATEFVSKLLAKTKKPAPEHSKGLNVILTSLQDGINPGPVC